VKRIGFSIIGKDRDMSGKSPRRWNRFRPTVAFGLQKDVPFDQLVLAYQPAQEELLTIIQDDIRNKINAGNERDFEITSKIIKFQNVYDFDECYRVLSELLKSLMTADDDRFYANMNTGTHTMQFAMYAISEQNLLPVTIVQTFPGDEVEYEKEQAFSCKSHAQVIDISWIKYPQILKDIDKRHDSFFSKTILVDTNHEDLREKIKELVDIGSSTYEPILLLGPTGTGKTRIARTVHSAWADRMKKNLKKEDIPFRDINCAGLSPELAYSQIFGHVKGSFTGAVTNHDGIMKESNGGTLFLDEIGELDMRTQAMLLKVLETGKYYRLGDPKTEHESLFRLICATNKDLGFEIKKGGFREDLYARIRSWVFNLPGLKERHRDIDPNIDYELAQWSKDKRQELRSPVKFDKKAREVYLKFAISDEAQWTGNFRDLSQSVRRMATRASLDNKGCVSKITVTLVAKEILDLKSLWRSDIDYVVISDEEIFKQMINRVRRKHPSTALMSAIEIFMQEMALSSKNGNKAEVSKLLYEEPNNPLGNPTAKFNARASQIRRNE